MRWSLRATLLVSYIGLITAMLLVGDLLIDHALSDQLLAGLDRRIETTARAAGRWLEANQPPAEVAAHAAEALDPHARATILGPSGAVLADSSVSEPALASMEGGDRAAGGPAPSDPEIVAARQGQVGRASRQSSALGLTVRALAVPAAGGRVVRLAVPLDALDQVRSALHARLLAASLVALVLALLLAALVSRAASRPLDRMSRAATALSQGRFDLSLPPTGRDSVGQLSRALGQVAEKLQQRVGDLTSQRDRQSEMLDRMDEGVLLIDRERRVFVANPAAVRILETEKPLVGGTVAEAIRHPGARAAIDRALDRSRPSQIEVEPLGLSRRTALLNVQPLSPDVGGGALAVFHDVTRLRRLETTRRDFVANVSHEFRTPVASIQASAETLLDSGLEDRETARRFVDVIHRNAQRLGRLVADLLELSHLEARASDPARQQPVVLADVVNRVLDTVRPQARVRSMSVTCEVPEAVVARGDADGIEQMVLNLVDNAIKYGKDGGHVQVIATAPAPAARAEPGAVRWVELSVVDDGPGIESRHLPRIFERFYRVNEGRSTATGGSGLGLSIVSHLAESMGGQVTARSEVGRGSSFTIRLPRADADPASADAGGPGADA